MFETIDKLFEPAGYDSFRSQFVGSGDSRDVPRSPSIVTVVVEEIHRIVIEAFLTGMPPFKGIRHLCLCGGRESR